MRLLTLFLIAAPAFAQFGNATRVWGRPIDSAVPTNGYALTWSTSLGQWTFGAPVTSGFSAGYCDISTGGSIGATPTFNASSCNSVAGTYSQFSNATTPLTANVTSYTLSNLAVGMYVFRWYQGTGAAYTVAHPAAVKGGCTIDPTLSTYTIMTGFYDGTNLYVNGNCSTSDTQFILRGPTRSAPAAPTTGIACWYDSTTLGLQCNDTNAQQYGMPLMTTYASTGTALLTPTANPVAFPLLCSASPGTTINGLVKIDTAGKAYTPATAADNIGAVGIATATCTSGSVLVVTQGIIRVNFDATAVVKGDYVLGSTATAAKVTSSGNAQPANGIQIIGRVVDESGAGSNAYKVNVNISSMNPNPGTSANCSSSASPAVCGAAAAGTVVVAAAATTVVVNTTAVTANSIILLMYDSSLGTKLGVTCNVTEPALYGVTARTAATSFTITASAPITNPACLSYLVVN